MNENTNELQIRYIPITHIVPTYQNAKKHNIGDIIESIFKYGFLVPISVQKVIDYEHLNDHYLQMEQNGEEIFALMAGNGRCAGVSEINKMVNRGDKELPNGLKIKDGIVLVPSIIGATLETVELFESFSLDDNLIGLSGGNLTPLDMSRMFDQENFLKMLERNIGTVTVFDGDDLDLLMQLHQQELEEPLQFDEELPLEDKPKVIFSKIVFDTEIDKQDFSNWLKDSIETYPLNTSAGFVILDTIGLV